MQQSIIINAIKGLRCWLAHWKYITKNFVSQRSREANDCSKKWEKKWRNCAGGQCACGWARIRIPNPSNSFIIQQQILSTSSASAVLLWRPTKPASFLWIQFESAVAALFHFVLFICSSPLSALLVLFLFSWVRWNPNLLLLAGVAGKAHRQNQIWFFYQGS